MHSSAPIVIDCFAGAGGLSLGLSQAGFAPGAAFDASRASVATYARNFGPHVIEGRAEELTGARLLEFGGISAGACTLVAGGPPCQGFSRQRRGQAEDDRNDLVFEFLRLVTEIEPLFFMMENVSAIQGKRAGSVLKRLLGEARDAGYHVSFKVLDAADYGVPQHRKRAFIVGERADRPASFEFPHPTHSPERWKTVREAIGDLPEPTVGGAVSDILNHDGDHISALNRLRISHVPPGGGRADIPEHLRLACHRVDVETAGHRGVYGRLPWDRPAGTITTKCNSFTRGRFAHPEEDRNITMREAARLQSFPDSFFFTGGKVEVAHQIGNAVPPPLAFHLGRALIDALERRMLGEAHTSMVQLSLPFPRVTNERI